MTRTLGALLGPECPPALTDIPIHGLSADSRQITDKKVFFALKGEKVDGMSFGDQVAAKGAAAIVTDNPIGPAAIGETAVVRVDNARRTLALSAARWFPNQPKTIAAVTGTSGKTSVASFVRQIFAAQGFQAASIGTIGVVRPSGEVYGGLTTPDPVTLHETLQTLADEGVTHCAFEASSHGLDQHRLDGVRITAAAFTNLSRDHLDYHGTVQAYLNAKTRLFSELLPAGGAAVIMDGPFAASVARAAEARGQRVLMVGRATDGPASGLVVRAERIEGAAQILTVEAFGLRRDIRLPLIGTFQADNALVAAGLAVGCGLTPTLVLDSLEKLQGAMGRLEFVATHQGAPIVVDYAHKPDALEKVLTTLRPFAKGRLVVVFGCGGDRDAGKRPIMGEIAVRLADKVIVTDDNPRTEDPALIRKAVLEGAKGAVEIGDRAEAIEKAVSELNSGDLLVIAGKGHESGQTIGSMTLPFSDHDVVRRAVEAHS